MFVIRPKTQSHCHSFEKTCDACALCAFHLKFKWLYELCDKNGIDRSHSIQLCIVEMFGKYNRNVESPMVLAKEDDEKWLALTVTRRCLFTNFSCFRMATNWPFFAQRKWKVFILNEIYSFAVILIKCQSDTNFKWVFVLVGKFNWFDWRKTVIKWTTVR